jgi:carboxymethylenebutenolidase
MCHAIICYAEAVRNGDEEGRAGVKHAIVQTSYSNNGSPTPASMYRPSAARGALPAVIVVHGAFGADAHIHDVADRVAAAGYLAFVPDLYAHGEGRPAELAADRVAALRRFADTLPPGGLADPDVRGHALATLPDTDRGRVEESFAAMRSTFDPPDPFVGQLRGAVAHLRDHPDCNGQIGALGFSTGGHLTGLLACEEPDLGAAVVFYGDPPPPDRAAAIACPMLGIYGGKDARITSAVPDFAEAMEQAGKRFDQKIYPGAPHGFFNDSRPRYRVRAARDAWARTLAFLVEQLG